MNMLKVMLLGLILAALYGCGESRDEEILVPEALDLSYYYGDPVEIGDYISGIGDYHLDDDVVLENLTVGNHQLYIHYVLDDIRIHYKRLMNINVKAVNLGHQIASETIGVANYQIRYDELQKGKMENLDFISNALVLRDNQNAGRLETPVYETPMFNSLVASWNSLTAPENHVEVMVRVRVDGIWSRYFSYQKWAKGGYNRTLDASDDLASLSIDTLDVAAGKYASAFQLSVNFGRSSTSVASPKLNLLAVALTMKDPVSIISQSDYFRILTVPMLTQMDEPVIGNIICSPTSTTMVLNSLGITITKGAFASLAKDQRSKPMYGNWSFNVAAAGELGACAYVVRMTDIEDAKEYIAHDQPLVVSIRSSAANPLTGAPMQYTSGHLMVLKGFAMRDGVEYVVVNDPADGDVNHVEHYYKLSEFNNTWNGYAYIISK